MARIKIDSLQPITITSIVDFNLSGVTNLKLIKVIGTTVDNSGNSLQTSNLKNVTVIPNVYRVAWYEE